MADVLKIRSSPSEPWHTIVALKGEQGEQGPAGENYTLTAADKQEIAALVLAALPSSEEVSY